MYDFSVTTLQARARHLPTSPASLPITHSSSPAEQAVAMLLFNDRAGPAPFEELRVALGLEEPIAKKARLQPSRTPSSMAPPPSFPPSSNAGPPLAGLRQVPRADQVARGPYHLDERLLRVQRRLHVPAAQGEWRTCVSRWGGVKEALCPLRKVRRAGCMCTHTHSLVYMSAAPPQVRIPLASLEDDRGAKRVEEDRSTTIEAAVVRIMKARSTIGGEG